MKSSDPVREGVLWRLLHDRFDGNVLPIEETMLMLLLTRPRLTLSMVAQAAEYIHRV